MWGIILIHGIWSTFHFAQAPVPSSNSYVIAGPNNTTPGVPAVDQAKSQFQRSIADGDLDFVSISNLSHTFSLINGNAQKWQFFNYLISAQIPVFWWVEEQDGYPWPGHGEGNWRLEAEVPRQEAAHLRRHGPKEEETAELLTLVCHSGAKCQAIKSLRNKIHYRSIFQAFFE